MNLNQNLFQQIATKPSPKCTCGDCEAENQFYQCNGCERLVPWCYGSSDIYWEYCDSCADKLPAASHPQNGDRFSSLLHFSSK